MKAFEKWWSEELSDEALEEIRSHAHLTNKEKVDRLAKISWRASKKHYLKWVSSMLWLADGQVVNEVKERIQQELEEE